MPTEISFRKVQVSRDEIRLFNASWPCSELRASRSYWFEFDDCGDLVDTDCPQSDEGRAATAIMEDCRAFCFDDIEPEWSLTR